MCAILKKNLFFCLFLQFSGTGIFHAQELAQNNLTPLQEAILQWEEEKAENTILRIIKKEDVRIEETRTNTAFGWIQTTKNIQPETDSSGRKNPPGVTRDKILANWLLTETGITPLHAAAYTGNILLAEQLLAAGHPRNPTGKKWKWTPLRIAAERKDIRMAHTLLGIKEGDAAKNNRIQIDLENQTLTLEKRKSTEQGKNTTPVVLSGNWEPLLKTPISSGREKFNTPTGTYFVSDKHRVRKSNLYHVNMPYFMRLSLGAIGIHQGVVPNHPASHGCVRVPTTTAARLFSLTPTGTEVNIF
jgi:lipoprotein-anchoring transpeptidase ErfK/SrfK